MLRQIESSSQAVSTGARHWVVSGIGFFAGFAIPTSTAAENLGAFLLLCLLVLPEVRREFRPSLMRSVALSCLTLYALLVAGALYTSTPEHAPNALLKMRMFLLVPIFIAACSLITVRRSLVIGFISAAALSLLISLVSALLGRPIYQGVEGNWTVFRTHTYHNLFIAWFLLSIISGLFAHQFDKRYFPIIGVTFLLGLFDVFFLVQGRTGHLLFLLMLMLVVFLWNQRKGLLVSFLIMVIGVPMLLISSKIIQERFQAAQTEINNFAQNKQEETSLGLRLSWYKDTVPIVFKAPFFGHGTGSFQTEFRRHKNVSLDTRVKMSPLLATNNPHNDYLFIAVELGLAGVVALLLVFYTALRSAAQMPSCQKWMIWVIVGSISIGSLGNSFVTDNITGTGFILLLSALIAGPLWDENDAFHKGSFI